MSASSLTSHDFYERLEVSRTASAEEIKRAYQRKLRTYPPERAPEEFKLIREAFETLGNPESRQEYDDRPDPQAVAAFERALDAMREKDYATAERLLKQVLLLDPNRGFVRNMLGLSYLYQGQAQRAAEQFDRLTCMPDAPAAWFGNAASAAAQLEDWPKALVLFKEAIRRATDGDVAGYIVGLASAYISQKRYEETRKLLEDAIDADGRVDFEDLRYFTKLLELDVIERDLRAVERDLARIQKIAEDEDQRRYLAFRLGRLAIELVEVSAFEYAIPIARLASALQPADADYSGLEQVGQLLKANRLRDAIAFMHGHPSFQPDGWLGALVPTVVDFCVRNQAREGLQPITSAPWLYTLNGIGTTLYGEAEPDVTTRSVVKVLWFTILFVPVLPLARYRVIPEGENGYRFMGKLPLTAWLTRWRAILLGALALWVLQSILYSKGSTYASQAASGSTATAPAVVGGSESDPILRGGLGPVRSVDAERDVIERERTALKDLADQLDSADRSIELSEMFMESDKRDIEQYERDQGGRITSDAEYRRRIREYNGQVEIYNTSIQQRRTRYEEYKQRLDAFNAAVDRYNARR